MAAADLAPSAGRHAADSGATSRGGSASPSVAAGERGALTIAEEVVEKIARAAALGCRGVASVQATSSGVTGKVSGALGRDLPRVDAEVAGHRADVQVRIASLWPHAAAAVADDVRSEVAAQLSALAGITADVVSVAIVKVVHPVTRERARVQ